ncbi:MAG: helix-turn-helix domain-containing protein, partial [Mycobacterium sp.]
MAESRSSAPDRLAIGQLLVRLLREFRDDLAAPRADAGYGDVREPHFQIFGNIRMGGIRLTELADRAQLSLAATSELVNDLADLGYLTRRPDP